MSAARPLLIVNPSSGKMAGGRSLTRFAAAVEGILGDVDFEVTERRGHAIDLARRGALEGRTTIVAVGGDGTLNEVVNGVMQARAASGAGGPAPLAADALPPPAADAPSPPAADTPVAGPRVGLIGLGTGGDFGRSIGIGRSLDDYLRALAEGQTRAIDLLHVGFRDDAGRPCVRYVVNVASVGPGGLVDRYVERFPRLLGGRLSYGLAAAWALVECPRIRLRVRLTGLAGARPGDSVERVLSTYLLGLCNGAVFGGGMRLAPAAAPDDGLLDVVSIAPDSKWVVARKLPTVYRGRHLDVAGVELLRCRGLAVEPLDESAAEGLTLDVDGEALGRLPLRAELLPGALSMLAPARRPPPLA